MATLRLPSPSQNRQAQDQDPIKAFGPKPDYFPKPVTEAPPLGQHLEGLSKENLVREVVRLGYALSELAHLQELDAWEANRIRKTAAGKGGAAPRRNVADRHREWTALAFEVRRRNPTLSPAAIARRIAVDCEASADHVARAIRPAIRSLKNK